MYNPKFFKKIFNPNEKILEELSDEKNVTLEGENENGDGHTSEEENEGSD